MFCVVLGFPVLPGTHTQPGIAVPEVITVSRLGDGKAAVAPPQNTCRPSVLGMDDLSGLSVPGELSPPAKPGPDSSVWLWLSPVKPVPQKRKNW